jgi:predicted MFS family arabinose efflux permease
LSALSFILVWTRLPETRSDVRPDDSGRLERPPVFSRRFWKSFREGGSAVLPLLLGSALILALGQSSLYSAFPLYCEAVFSMSSREIGLLFAAMGLTAVVVQGGLVRPLMKMGAEKRWFAAGNFLMAAALLLLPFMPSRGWLTSALILLGVGASLNGPMLTSLISREAAPGRSGAALGRAQGMAALGRVIGPAWGGALYALSKPLPFWATAAVVSLTFFAAVKLEADK